MHVKGCAALVRPEMCAVELRSYCSACIRVVHRASGRCDQFSCCLIVVSSAAAVCCQFELRMSTGNVVLSVGQLLKPSFWAV